MSGLHGDFTSEVLATSNADEVPATDVAMVFVNGYNTLDAADTAKKVLKPTGYCITFQNGLGNLEILNDVLGMPNVLGGLSFHSADTQSPGKVIHTNQGPTYLGEQDRKQTTRLTNLASLLEKANMEPVVEEDIVATIWGKFVHNCGINAVCAITNLRPGHIQEVPELNAFQTEIIEEALSLVKAKGIRLPDPNPLESIKAYSSKKFHRVSMQQHLDNGKLTEIDSLNGYIVRESRKLGLNAPANAALTSIMKGRHHTPRVWPCSGVSWAANNPT